MDSLKISSFAFIFCCLFSTQIVFAADFGNAEVPLPGQPAGIGDIAANGLLPYMQILINYLTVGIVLIAVILIVVGGFTYMTAAGDASKVSKGKSFIGYALLGITLTLCSYLILNTISSQFTTDLQEPGVLLQKLKNP